MKYDAVDLGINTFQYLLTAVQTNEQLRMISLILSIISTAFIVLPKIYMLLKSGIKRMVAWYHNAKKDGKITKDELKEGVEIVDDTIGKITDVIEDVKDKKEG